MYYIIMNPASKSGRGIRIWEKIEPVLKKRQIPSLKVLYSRENPITPQVLEDEQKEVTGRRSLPGSISFVPPVAGLLIAGEIVREICGVG